MRTYEISIISNRIGFMYDWRLKSCVGSYVCAIIFFLINSLNDYLLLNTDRNLTVAHRIQIWAEEPPTEPPLLYSVPE